MILTQSSRLNSEDLVMKRLSFCLLIFILFLINLGTKVHAEDRVNHIVKPGETLSEIVHEYVKPKQIPLKGALQLTFQINPSTSKKKFIHPGDQILLPSVSELRQSFAEEDSQLSLNSEEHHYLVKDGDRLWEIASRYRDQTPDLDTKKLIQLISDRNGLTDPNQIKTGRWLVLPNQKSNDLPVREIASDIPSLEDRYFVKPGDALSLLVQKKYKPTHSEVPLRKLMKSVLELNPELRNDPNRILTGTWIVLPPPKELALVH